MQLAALLVLPTLFLLAGCVERRAAPPRGIEPIGPVYGPHTAAQTFFSENAALIGVDVRLATYARRNAGTVTFRLRTDPGSAHDLRTVTVQAADVEDNAVHRFRFPAVGGPGGVTGLAGWGVAHARLDPYPRPLAFVIESTAAGPDDAITVWTSREESQFFLVAQGHPYNWVPEADGHALYDGEPRPADLVFAPVYAEPLMDAVAAQVGRFLASPREPLTAVLVVLLPGFTLATLCLSRRRYGLGTQLAASPAYGVSGLALTALWAHAVGLEGGLGQMWGLLLACGGAIVALEVVRVGMPRKLSRAELLEPLPWERADPWSRVLAALLTAAGRMPGLRACNRPYPRKDIRDTHLRVARGAGLTPSRPPDISQELARPRTWPRSDWALVAVLAAAAAGLLARFVAMGDGAVPPGADSYHHTLITQLILDRGGLPDSYHPYAPIPSFSYHFGFHAVAGATSWITGLTALDAVVLVGLLLNVLIALSVYAFAVMAGLGRGVAVGSALVVGLISPFPAWLLDVARYPQEAALVILPVALAVAAGTGSGRPVSNPPPQPSPAPASPLRARGEGDTSIPSPLMGVGEGGGELRARLLESVRAGVGLAVLSAGLFLTHYRLALVYLGFVAAWVVWAIVRGANTRLVLLGMLGGLLLAAPWIVRLAQQFTLGIRGSGGRYGPEYYSWDRLGTALGHPGLGVLLIVGLVGVAMAVRARQAPILVLVGGAGLWLAFSNPHWLPLPGAGAVDSVTVASSLFIPVSIAAAYAAAEVWRLLESRIVAVSRPLGVAFVLALAVWGSAQLPSLFEPDDRLADDGDLEAARWVQRSLPPTTLFAVNAVVRDWKPDFVVPSDGGQWLPLLAGRSSTLLPLTYPAERETPAEAIERMERLARLMAADPGSPTALDALRGYGVTHVYFGARGGPMDEGKVERSAAYRRVYGARGVSIYEVSWASPDRATPSRLAGEGWGGG